MKIERTILNTRLNELEVIKTVEVTKLPKKQTQEFCVSVCVATEILSETRFKQPSALDYDSVSFFGETYEEANTKYLAWLDDIVSDEDAIYNKARGVQCLLNELMIKG